MVILHILQSINGRVPGSFMGEAYGLVSEYGSIRNKLAPDCFIHGATTAKQLYARETVPGLAATRSPGSWQTSSVFPIQAFWLHYLRA